MQDNNKRILVTLIKLAEETSPLGRGGIGDTLAGRFVFAGCCVRRFVSSGKYYPVGKEWR